MQQQEEILHLTTSPQNEANFAWKGIKRLKMLTLHYASNFTYPPQFKLLNSTLNITSIPYKKINKIK